MMTVIRQDTGESASFEVLRVDWAPGALVTSHPVEFGAEVTDHVQRLPLAFTVEAFVTASPRSILPQPFAVEDAIAFLDSAIGALCVVSIDGEGAFSSCVIEGVQHSRTSAAGRALQIRVKQIRIAAAVSVPIPASAPAPVAAVGAPSAVVNGQVAALQQATLTAAAAGATAGLNSPVSGLAVLRNLLSPFH